MSEIENMNRIDKLLQPEVDNYISAAEKSFEKYGNVFHADEFLPKKTLVPKKSKKIHKLLLVILFLTLILVGCTWYQIREVKIEFGDYTKNTIKRVIPKDAYWVSRERIYTSLPSIKFVRGDAPKLVENKFLSQTGKASWYEITGYCLNQQPMASGKKVYKGAIACPGFLKLGTRVEIKGQEYICEDRMALKYRDGNYIDIWFENCQEALNWGRRKMLLTI